MTLLVQKYGGTSVESVDQIKAVAQRVSQTKDAGIDVVMVLSAMGDATDRLADLARSATHKPKGRELDSLLATGEQVSVALMSMVLNSMGCSATSYTGSQVRILTDGAHGKARIQKVETEKLRADLDADRVPVVAGFQGVDESGNTTTIGQPRRKA